MLPLDSFHFASFTYLEDGKKRRIRHNTIIHSFLDFPHFFLSLMGPIDLLPKSPTGRSVRDKNLFCAIDLVIPTIANPIEQSAQYVPST